MKEIMTQANHKLLSCAEVMDVLSKKLESDLI